MKNIKRIQYNTMNSWNGSTAPAYNLKVYNVVDDELQSKVYEMMESEDFYDEIDFFVREFGASNDYEYQAGFNGRSVVYLVLYRGGKENGRIYTKPGQSIDEKDVPVDVLRRFRALAVDIVRSVENMAKNAKVEEVDFVRTEKRKVLSFA